MAAPAPPKKQPKRAPRKKVPALWSLGSPLAGNVHEAMVERLSLKRAVEEDPAEQAALDQAIATQKALGEQFQASAHQANAQHLALVAPNALQVDAQQMMAGQQGMDFGMELAQMQQMQEQMQAPAASDVEAQNALIAATQEAQQAQILQQAQFWQQLQMEEAQRVAKAYSSGEFQTTECRFKENFRPFRFCKHWLAQACWRGEDCTFAHTFEELHPASPDLPKVDNGTSALAEMGKVEESKIPDMRMQKKKEMCKNYKTNECILGRTCPYAHGEHELGTLALVITDRVKTKLCKFWQKGDCIFGNNCVSAHGEKELGLKRPPFTGAPPMKKRKEGESLEEFRASVLSKTKDK